MSDRVALPSPSGVWVGISGQMLSRNVGTQTQRTLTAPVGQPGEIKLDVDGARTDDDVPSRSPSDSSV